MALWALAGDEPILRGAMSKRPTGHILLLVIAPSALALIFFRIAQLRFVSAVVLGL